MRVAKGLLPVEQRAVIARQRTVGDFNLFQILQLVLRRFQPFGVRLFACQLGLDFLILDDAALFHIDQQHFARLQPPFADDIVFLDRKHAAFRCHDDMVIVGDAETGRAQAVAIKGRTDLSAIGKGNRGRAVPWFHQRCVIFVKGAPVGIHHRIAGPCFGNQHHHRMGEAISASEQKFERIVETGCIRLPVRDDRPHFVEIGAHQVRFHRAAASVHPVHIAANRIDLAIMCDKAIGVCELPAREGVGRKSLVDERQRRLAQRVTQIVIKAAYLPREQQTFIDHRARRHGWDIETAKTWKPVLFLQSGKRVLRLFTNGEQLALKCILISAIRPTADEQLPDDGHLLDHCLAKTIECRRHIAPAEDRLAFLYDEAFEVAYAEFACRFVLRQKAHHHGIIAQ